MNEIKKDPLDQLIEAADSEILGELIHKLAATRPEMRRKCFEFLKDRVTLTPDEDAVSSGEAIMALWMELEPDLSELDEYGGGDYKTEDHVGSLLYELSENLKKERVPRDHRQDLLDEVLPYIRSGNAGMDDPLYDVAYAACFDEDDLRDLAERFEAIGRDWPIDHARRIYRNIGDQDKYLELRFRRMEYGADYHDLATFYWDSGDKDTAIETARRGLKKAKGRMDELRTFMMERTRESGDRSGYLKLQFVQATDRLTLESYKAFKKTCSKKEWADYEPQLLKELDKAWETDRIKIHMFRKEYDKALSLLTKLRYPDTPYGGDEILKIAEKLEQTHPKEIFAFYQSGLGNLDGSFDRKTYQHKARVMAKVRHM